MIRRFLYRKYGEFVTNEFLTSKNEVIKDNFNKKGRSQQLKIKRHLRRLVDVEGERLVPDTFLRSTIDWGMDFSGWIGKFDNRKDFLILGAEPHLKNNYQLIYGFGSQKGNTISQSALSYYADESDIWHYLTKNFSQELDNKGIVSFLQKCYISDLCHLVPIGCSQVGDICAKLSISQGEWKEFRTKIAKSFLIEEIETVKPKYIILHGAKSREFFVRELKVFFTKKKQIANWDGYVYQGEMRGYKVIAIPHLSGQIRNELWRSKDHVRRGSVKKIIQSYLKE